MAVSQFADWPILAKVTQWAIALHMGLLFGWANQLVLALVGIGLIVMIVYGYRMWWSRRPVFSGRSPALSAPRVPARSSQIPYASSPAALDPIPLKAGSRWKSLPSAPARGALADLPPAAAAALVGALLFAGWFLPVFGASLVAFVVVDVLLGLRARRKAHAAG